jgi:phosphate/phosphite/phosphonate ABC transporter binding protein
VAVKVLRTDAAADPEKIRRLLREAHLGGELDHEHLVQVLDLGEEDGRWYVAMEYVRGYTLGHLLAFAGAHRELVPIQLVVHVVRAIASALEHVHAAQPGLMHRDVSPSNVLLGVDGKIKLSDFGVAGLTGTADAERVAGKPGYLPPEAFRSRGGGGPSPPPRPAEPCGAPPAHPTPAWDVYALGVTLYEALTSRRAFPGEDWREIGAAVERGAPAVTAARLDCPRALIDVVDSAIHRDPDRRFRTAGALREALDRAVPRAVDDGDRLREYLMVTYARKSFQGAAGALPSTGDAIATVDLKPTTPPSAASLSPLRFGLSPALGASTARAGGEKVAARLEAMLGRGVRTVVVGSYRDLVAWLAAGEIDFAWMPPVAFVDASEQGARSVAVARRNGRTTYESAVIVRAESPYRALEDLRGQSVAWVDRESAGGYLYAVAELVRAVGSHAGFFKREHFLGSHQGVCEAVANGWAEAGATYVVRDAAGAIESAAWVDLLGARAAELRPLAFTGPIPGDNIAHRPGLEADVVDSLAIALSLLAKDDAGRAILSDVFNADDFVRVDDALYDAVRETVKTARRA